MGKYIHIISLAIFLGFPTTVQPGVCWLVDYLQMWWRCSAFPSLLSCVKADFGSLFKSDWGTISLRHLTSKRSVCLVSNYKVCFPSSIWPMISLLAWSKNRLCTWTVHLLSVHYLFLSTLDFMQFWSNPLWWFKWAFVLDAEQC